MQRKQDAWFPASSSVLDASALVEQVLPRYGLAEPIQCRLISSSLNDVYKAQSGGETFYLRISRHGWRTGSEIAAETAFLAELRRRGLAVVAALPRDDGGMLSPLAAVEGGTLGRALSRRAGRNGAGDHPGAMPRLWPAGGGAA